MKIDFGALNEDCTIDAQITRRKCRYDFPHTSAAGPGTRKQAGNLCERIRHCNLLKRAITFPLEISSNRHPNACAPVWTTFHHNTCQDLILLPGKRPSRTMKLRWGNVKHVRKSPVITHSIFLPVTATRMTAIDSPLCEPRRTVLTHF